MRNSEVYKSQPSKGIAATVTRLFSVLSASVQTRLELAVVELEEEKSNLFRLLIMVGLTLVFTAFGVMSLLMYLLLSADPAQRLFTLLCVTGTFFALTIILVIALRIKAKRFTLLKETRKQLSKDVSALSGD